MSKTSNRYLTVSASVLIVAILVSLAAILVSSVSAPEMGGKATADQADFVLRKSLPPE
jgi:hypothetical protein